MNITDYSTRQLQPGEELVRVIRQHPAVLAPGVGWGGLLVIVDFFLLAWWFQHRVWGAIGFIIILLIGLILVSRAIFVWSRNALVITSHRVMDFDQRGFFERNVSEAAYEKIQDVRYTIRGFWPTLMHFGTIILQTAGSTTNLELEAVHHPVEIQQLITDLQQQARQRRPTNLSATELLEVVDRLKTELGPEKLQRILNDDEHG